MRSELCLTSEKAVMQKPETMLNRLPNRNKLACFACSKILHFSRLYLVFLCSPGFGFSPRTNIGNVESKALIPNSSYFHSLLILSVSSALIIYLYSQEFTIPI